MGKQKDKSQQDSASGEDNSLSSEISEIPPHPYGPSVKVKCQNQHIYHL